MTISTSDELFGAWKEELEARLKRKPSPQPAAPDTHTQTDAVRNTRDAVVDERRRAALEIVLAQQAHADADGQSRFRSANTADTAGLQFEVKQAIAAARARSPPATSTYVGTVGDYQKCHEYTIERVVGEHPVLEQMSQGTKDKHRFVQKQGGVETGLDQPLRVVVLNHYPANTDSDGAVQHSIKVLTDRGTEPGFFVGDISPFAADSNQCSEHGNLWDGVVLSGGDTTQDLKDALLHMQGALGSLPGFFADHAGLLNVVTRGTPALKCVLAQSFPEAEVVLSQLSNENASGIAVGRGGCVVASACHHSAFVAQRTVFANKLLQAAHVDLVSDIIYERTHDKAMVNETDKIDAHNLAIATMAGGDDDLWGLMFVLMAIEKRDEAIGEFYTAQKVQEVHDWHLRCIAIRDPHDMVSEWLKQERAGQQYNTFTQLHTAWAKSE
jgi:hypothetical protein